MKQVLVGSVSQLWRYPVKSMAGEQLLAGDIQAGGIHGDRGWAARDEKRGEIVGAKRIPLLMRCRAVYPRGPEGGVDITLPDGSRCDSSQGDAHLQLSQFLGHGVTLHTLREVRSRGHFRLSRTVPLDEMRRQLGIGAHEADPDLSEMPLSLLMTLSKNATLPGTYFDAYPLHVLTTTSLETLSELQPAGSFDVRRFRPNIVIKTNAGQTGLPEFMWCGGMLTIGGVVIRCEIRTIRCAMPAYAQPGLEKDARVLSAVRDAGARHLGIYASVVVPGRIEVGDPVTLSYPRFPVVWRSMRDARKIVKKEVLNVWARFLRSHAQPALPISGAEQDIR